jgi:pimeloyl-ACP methyl ester carboxylesterase
MPSRREALGAAASAAAVAALLPAASAAAQTRMVASEYWATKPAAGGGTVQLYVYRKRQAGLAPGAPVLFLVHGSSFSGRGGYDLQVPGQDYSMMDWFARRGFDVWTMDHEGYGRSTRTGGFSDIASGADDLAAGLAVVERETGVKAPLVYGQSSGGLRAGLLAMRQPGRIARLILDGFSHTGDGAAEILRRRANVAMLRASPTRAATPETYVNIFSRDDPSTFDPAVPQALARYELALGDRIPNGTYLDMATKLPMVDPARLTMPVLMTRAIHDGNATEADLLDFFGKLPSPDRQFAIVDGVAHIAVLGRNRHRVLHVMHGFLTLPPLAPG